MDSALIAVFRQKGGAGADVEEREGPEEEGQPGEGEIDHGSFQGPFRRSEPVSRLAAVDVGEDQEDDGAQCEEERHEEASFHVGEGAAAWRRKSGRSPKESVKSVPASSARTGGARRAGAPRSKGTLRNAERFGKDRATAKEPRRGPP